VKKGSHKNQIIITTLALLLAVVGYISYDNRDTFTEPAWFIAPPYKRNFSVRVVFPASG
jgi:hypothetical protein